MFGSRMPSWHGLINYIDTKAKCHHPKNLTCKTGLCGRCLSEFIDWRFSQSCWYFRPSFVNCCPSNLLSRSIPPPPSCVSKYTLYMYTLCVGGGGGVCGPQADKHMPQRPFTCQFFQKMTFCYGVFMVNYSMPPWLGSSVNRIVAQFVNRNFYKNSNTFIMQDIRTKLLRSLAMIRMGCWCSTPHRVNKDSDQVSRTLHSVHRSYNSR